MSITEKLAQALRLMDEAYCDVGPRMDKLKGRQALMRSREALAEYDATPASEVTAQQSESDSDNFAGDGNNGWERIEPKPAVAAIAEYVETHGLQNTHLTDSEFWIRDSVALVQQVERLKGQRAEMSSMDDWVVHDCPHCHKCVDISLKSAEHERIYRDLGIKLSTLSAANARLAKDAERLDWLAANPRITEAHVNGKVEHAHSYVVVGHRSFTLREIIDAARGAAA